MSRVYYNEIEPYPAQWLRNLMAAGLIPAGDVDERSIIDVRSDDLAGYDQCHFFSGLGGWPYALSGAGWGDRPVWTGSCPCQPFSVAGNGEGFDDPRHLWPHFKRLIAERRPPVVFGEQVAAAAKWLNLVRGDLETLDYAVGCIPMEAASADADHFRDRYWFVADCDGAGSLSPAQGRIHSSQEGSGARNVEFERQCVPHSDSTLADRIGTGLRSEEHRSTSPAPAGMQGADGQRQRLRFDAGADGADVHRSVAVADNSERGPKEPGGNDPGGQAAGRFEGYGNARKCRVGDRAYVECPDGKWRRLPPPGVRWLGNGISARIPKMRAIGNAIDPRPARQFITAYMAARGITSIREVA